MGETGYVDHDLSPPWTLLNIAKELKFGLFIEPPEQHTIERNIAFEWQLTGSPFQEQSRIPDAPEGSQAVFIPTARADNCPVPAIIEEHKLYFNPHIISLMFLPGMYINQFNPIHAMSIKAYAQQC